MRHYTAIALSAPGKVTDDIIGKVQPYPGTRFMEVFNDSPYFVVFRFAGKSIWIWPDTAPIFRILGSMAFDGQIQATIAQQPDQFNTNLVPDGIVNGALYITGYELESEIPVRREISPKQSRARVPYAIQGASISGVSNRSNQIYIGDCKELYFYVKVTSLPAANTITFGVDSLMANGDWDNLYTSAALAGPFTTIAPGFDRQSIGPGLQTVKSIGGIVSVTWSIAGGGNGTMAPSLIAK